MEQRLQTYLQFLSDDQNAGNPETLEYLETMLRLLEQAGIADTVREPAVFFYLNLTICGQSDMPAFQDAFMFLAVLILAGLLPAIFLIRTATTPEERELAKIHRRECQA